MSQVTNLNVAPYFDDFNNPQTGAKDAGYYQVLFKPGYPVQARELTTLQSILQNQVETFGQHFFKEGARVIPGNVSYIQKKDAIQLQNTYLGVPVGLYANSLIDKKITGLTSGISARVDSILLQENSERNNLTLYITYLSSNAQTSQNVFSDGELLVCAENIITEELGSTIISAGEPFASTIESSAATYGSSFSVNDGIYFIRGRFIKVDSETILLDQYNSYPSYKIGFRVKEEIVNADLDENLTDNSNGFNNYAAPGADRLKITVRLDKVSLDNIQDKEFVEIARIIDGQINTISVTNTEYNIFANELARRTFDESGDYYVTPINVSVKNSLDDGLGNNGVFSSNRLTYGGSTPSDDLALYQISPGKAYVKGFEVELPGTNYLDVQKPRTTKTISNQAVNYSTGSNFLLNRVYGSPLTGIGNTYVLSLRDERVGDSQANSYGKEIGVARVYDLRLESGSYDSTNPNSNEWATSLFDVQTTCEMTLNENITLSIPTFIRGSKTGATAFLKDSVTDSKSLVLYEKTGNFIENEKLIINGIENGRVATAVTSYNLSDVKSVYGSTGVGNTFTADIVQDTFATIGFSTISEGSSGISTIISTNQSFPGNLVKVNDIVSYSSPDFSIPVFSRVVSVDSVGITVAGVTTVPSINEGSLPSTLISVNDLKVLKTKTVFSEDQGLYTKLPKKNISSVDLQNSFLTIRKVYSGLNISSNTISAISAGENETFLPFDEERYTLVRSDGSFEVLTSDKLKFANGSTELSIDNLGSDDSNATLYATLRKTSVKSKVKLKNRVNSILIDKSSLSSSGVGGTTLNDGLTYGSYPYGTRVQDEVISLNHPDVIEIHGIFESDSVSQEPSAPKLSLTNLTGESNTTSDLLIGEKVVGSTSGAIAIVAEIISTTEITYILKSSTTFVEGESLLFEESAISGIITRIDNLSNNISYNYTFNNGQNISFYGYGSIRRKSNAQSPSKKIRIYFSNGYYQSSDNGDITTANSYQNFNYSKDIQKIEKTRVTDIIDIRPRVNNYSVLESFRSPLEFYGRLFDQSGNSSTNILASDEQINLSYTFYLGRVDKIYLTRDASLQVKYGNPSENFESPSSVSDALEIGTITLPPYLYNPSDATIQLLEHKRYRMIDINRLENRIQNLEYYTALSLLESNAANLFIPDADGLNRFKSGFFVDNFTQRKSQEGKIVSPKNSVDTKFQELRPTHYTTSIDLISGSSTDDLSSSSVDGTNVKKSEGIITLDYLEIEWLKQEFGTRIESVTPYILSFWEASLELFPESDTWVDTVRIDPRIVQQEGNYTTLATVFDIDPQTGLSPINWGSWEDVWIGTDIIRTQQERSFVSADDQLSDVDVRIEGNDLIQENTFFTETTTVRDNFEEVITTTEQSRVGQRVLVTERFDTFSEGDRVVSREAILFMRSRNIQITGRSFKPNSRLYGFFDGVDVNKYIIPKLLEISMISGVFQVGEDVVGSMNVLGLSESPTEDLPRITFRVAQSNHRLGPYDNPTHTYPENPYTNQSLQALYSSTSNILNIDTFSLANSVQSSYGGWVAPEMVLVGQTSGARAIITSVRFVSDITSFFIGNLYLPNPNISGNLRFETGTKTFTMIDNPINNASTATTIGSDTFASSGVLETVQETIVSVRNANVTRTQEIENRTNVTTTGTQLVSTDTIDVERAERVEATIQEGVVVTPQELAAARQAAAAEIAQLEAELTAAIGEGAQNLQQQLQVAQQQLDRLNATVFPPPPPPRRADPLAQSFFVEDPSGVFITSCDIFFTAVDDENIPLIFQIRPVKLGLPTEKVLPFSEVIVEPSEIAISNNGSVPTNIKFKGPVYLESGIEYAICMLSNSAKYRCVISRVGENDLITQTFVANQPTLGSLFKSQNGSTWEPSQWEDLKFTLYRADFVSRGTINFYNPSLTDKNSQVAKLLPNSLSMNSRSIRVGLGSTLQDSGLILGMTILQDGTDGTANYIGNAGSAFGNLNIINAGIGYTPSSGSFTFNSVPLQSITSNGRGATASITIEDGVAIAATIQSGGFGYSSGDVLGITSIGSINVGQNARLSISSISDINELILDNVQGDFVVGVANTLKYVVNNAGISTTLNYSSGGNVQIQDINIINDGLHIIVNHKNHGMYFDENYVQISEVSPDVIPTKLVTSYSVDSTNPILVEDSSQFITFENVGVGTTNPGYLLIGDEVVSYTNVTSGSIGGIITRNVSGFSKDYPAGTPVRKYELNGVSLRRINKTHYLGDSTIIDPISFDSYSLKIDTTNSGGIGRTSPDGYPSLYFNTNKSSGGFNARASQNIPYEIVTPNVQYTAVKGTALGASLRTITGQSLSGDEIPYVESEIFNVSLNESNYLDSTRIVCSDINEQINVSPLQVSNNKSFNLSLNLATVDSRVSPVVDTQRVSSIFTSNRVNQAITNYIDDERISRIDTDPTAFQYITKQVRLKTPASSIKIYLAAHVNVFSDIRAFYSISNDEGSSPIFTPFPGFNNLDVRGNVIDQNNNDGLPDVYVSPSNKLGFKPYDIQYKDYVFTADNIGEFKTFRIKLVGTSTNQVFPPRIRDLRVIALA
jgi:hypothetical protein